MSNTWGALSWGSGSWAAQGDATLTLTGIGASYSIGNVVADAELQVGWGGDTWGENEWGDLSGSQPVAVGSQLTSSIGSVQENIIVDVSVSVTNVGQLAFGEPTVAGGASVAVNVSGQELSFSMGEEVINIGVILSSSNLLTNTLSGSVTIEPTQLTGIGWGRRSWGNLAWGGAYSAIAVGQELTSTINFPATGAFTDVNVSVTGQQLDITYASPSFSIQVDQDIFVLASEDQLDALTTVSTVIGHANVSVTGIQATMSVGTAVGGLKTPVDVTGIQASMTLGSIALEQSTNEPVTGQQTTMSIGSPSEIPGQIIGVGGLQLASSIGSVTATGQSNVDVTGIQMTISAGNTNVTAWAEVNPGVNNIWSEVDRAA